MGRDFYDASPEAKAILDQAELLSGGFLDTMFNGEAAAIGDTRVAQIALLTVGTAITEHLKARGIAPNGAAGHSLGEFTALVSAGSLSFEDAFRLVQVRARLMSEDVPPGSMAAVIGLAPDAIEEALPEGAQVANYNGPGQTIISGSVDAVEAAGPALKEAGAKRVLPLKVSGPFHSQLMAKGAEQFRAELRSITLNAPSIRFVSSVSGQEESDPETILALLSEQICAPVRWTDVMASVGQVSAIEAGPGKVLQGIAKRMDNAPEIALAGTLEAAQALEETS